MLYQGLAEGIIVKALALSTPVRHSSSKTLTTALWERRSVKKTKAAEADGELVGAYGSFDVFEILTFMAPSKRQ